MKLSFALPATKSQPVGAASSLKRPAAFASLDDDEPVDAAPTLSDDRTAAVAVNKQLLARNFDSASRATRRRMEKEKMVDETVYEYDGVWDQMQEQRLRQKEEKDADSKQRKPKYINELLNSAATRKLDHLRAEEKMMQREREAEGDEFKDKEAFVTQAYRDQMAEVRKAEEEEKQREELARKKNRGAPTGLSHLYRKLLEESEQQHELTVAAAEAKRPIIGPQGPMPNLTITRPPDYAPPSDLELARQAREQGREVELNDDNQIVDKRDLLAAGLNLSAPNTRRIGLLKSNMASGSTEPVQSHRAVGTAASRKEINDRRAREIERQVEEERQRAASEQERAEREATERIIARRNTQADVQNAKERYMERKRQKLEEEAMATDIDTHVHEQEPS